MSADEFKGATHPSFPISAIAPSRFHRRQRRLLGAMLLLLLLVTADYFFYPLLASPSGRSFNKGENGLWLRSTWYFGEKPSAEIRGLARRLNQEQIRYAFFHVRHIKKDGELQFHFPEAALRLTSLLHRQAPEVKVIAWISVSNLPSQGGPVDLARDSVRGKMVQEARWLIDKCGFDGVQWDYEICSEGDPFFLKLMVETRSVLPKNKLLSCAVPMAYPRGFRRYLGWSEPYYSQVAKTCDQIAVMGYDSGTYFPRAYVWLIRRQARLVPPAVFNGNPDCQVLLGLPGYQKGGPSHNPRAENLRLGLKGVREGLAGGPDSPAFAGVAIFADYTLRPKDWQDYRRWWLTESEK
jgi:hypothetical protein